VTVDCIVPARNEAPTVATVVDVCRQCSYVRDVIVVDDGSTDGTGQIAAAAGAKVVRREAVEGSKAHAMAEGVVASDARLVLFVDADCLGLSPSHLDAICAPVVDGLATMSIGTFDYGVWNPLVLRFPPTSGERIIPRWVFEAIPPAKLDGYTIELMITHAVTERRLTTAIQVMRGVTHRTKRDKFGPIVGWRLSWRMFWQLVGVLRVVRARNYWFYLRDMKILRQ
jgi:glycosyltransferase involved in cell wall biosynthesis